MRIDERPIAVICSRQNSTRLKDKSHRKICGQPLWYWTFTEINKARKCFADIYLSSDDEVLLHRALDYGIVPIHRRAELCRDDSKIDAVMQEFCKGRQTCLGVQYHSVCLVSPTNPLRTHRHIKYAVRHLRKYGADAVVSMQKCSPLEQHIIKAKDGTAKLVGYGADLRTQELPECYRLTGSIVHAKWDVWAKRKSIYEDCKIRFIDTGVWDVDINTKADLRIAEALLSWRTKRRTYFKNFMKR